MKAFQRSLSLVLTLVMLLSLYIGGLEMTSSAAESMTLKTGDLVTFGSYPQSEVKDEATLSALNKKSLSWKSYGYYSSDGSSGSGKPSDYMKYADVTYNGGKYRAVKFTSYRPYGTYQTCSADNSNQDSNGYVTDKVYWFKFEPIVWRVLDSGKGLLMTERLLDSQAFENDDYYGGCYYYGDKNYEHYASDWAYSSLREWLNGDFYKTAFASSAEKDCVRTTSLTTPSSYDSKFDAGPTKDKVFLLTIDDVRNSGYGFSSGYSSGEDTNRVAFGTDYAKCQGLYVNSSTGYYYSGASWWWLRTPEYDDFTNGVDYHGYVYSSFYINTTYGGIRAALNINLQSAISQSLIKKVKDSGNGDSEISYGTDNNISKDITYKKTSIPVKFSRDWFRPGSDKYVFNTVYDQGLATFCSDFALMGYNSNNGITKCLKACGFDVMFTDMNAGRDEVNTFIAAKTIETDSSTKKHLVFVGTIGSNGKQWYSNFDPAWAAKGNNSYDTKINLGFADARDFAEIHLAEQLTPENGFTKENTILLLTGHSRGAAAANLLAKKIISDGNWAEPENIYAYTFATPNVISGDDVHDEKYDCIFNIVNPEDFVTKVMLKKWGYSKYGTTYVLPSKTNTQPAEYNSMLKKMQKTYSVLTNGKKYKPYSLGESTTQAAIDLMGLMVPKVSKLYTKKFHTYGINWISPYEFFRDAMLPVLAEDDGTSIAISVTKILDILTDVLVPVDVFYKTLLLYFLDLDADLSLALITPTKILDAARSEILDFKVAHQAQTYCAYMHALTVNEVTRPKYSFIGAVNCPVDIEIIDKGSNETVGKIRDNVVDEDILAKDNSVVMTVNGDEKTFWLPSGGDYEVRLTGNDEGVMDYTLIKNDSEEGELERVNFFDVAVAKDEGYSAGISGEGYEVAEHFLLTDDGSEISPTETMSIDNAATYEVTLNVSGSGNVSGDTVYVSGDYADISATPEAGNGFVGWYDGGKLISAESNYRFRVSDNVKYTARFEKLDCQHENTVTINKIEPTASEEGYSGDIVCTVCYTLVSEGHALPAHDHSWDDGIITKTATCTEEGEITFTCTICNETQSESTPIDASNHGDYGTELVNAKEATETEDGYTGDKVCPACGAVVEAGAVIPKITQGYAPGDVNGDRDVLANDARLALRASAKLEELTDEQTLAADVNEDGQVLANDARQILRYSAKLQNEFEKG